MHLDFDYTVEDLRELHKIARKNKPAKKRNRTRDWMACFLFISLVATVAFLLNRRTPPALVAVPTPTVSNPLTDTLATIVPWILLLAATWIVIFRIQLGKFKNHSLLQKPISMEIDDIGIFSSDGSTQTRWLWIAFDRVVETEERFFLRLTENFSFVIVPKRTLANEAAINDARRVFQRISQGPRGAFPVLQMADILPVRSPSE